MITSVLFAPIISASVQNSKPLISFMCEAQPLKKALALLSEKTGLIVHVKGEIANGTAVFSVSNMPPQDFVKDLAKTICGKAIKTSDGFILIPSKKAIQSRNAAYQKRFKKEIMAKGSGWAPFPLEPPKLSPAEDSLYSKLLNACLSLGLDNLEANEKVVYSVKPNLYQKQLPASIANEFVGIDLKDSKAKFPAVPTDGILEIVMVRNRYSNFDNMAASYQIVLKDRNGRVFAETTKFLPKTPLNGLQNASPMEAQVMPMSSHYVGKKVSNIFKLFATGNGDIITKIYNQIQNAVNYDPLLYDGETLLEIAQFKKENLIAVLPDQAMDVNPLRMRVNPIDTKDALQNLPNVLALSDREQSGTLVVGPGNPTEEDSHYVDRTYFNSLRGSQFGYLNDVYNQWVSIGSNYHGYIPSFYNAYIFKRSSLFPGPDEFNLFYVISQLDPQNLQILQRGNSVPFGNLSNDAQAALVKLLLSPTVQIARNFQPYVPKKPAPVTFNQLLSGMTSQIGISTIPFNKDITDELPNGIPADALLTILFKRSFTFQGQYVNPQLYGIKKDSFSSHQVAFYLAAERNPKISPYLPQISDFQTRPTESITLKLSNLTSKSLQMTVGAVLTGDDKWQSVGTSITGMPERVKEIYNEIRKFISECKVTLSPQGDPMLVHGKNEEMLSFFFPLRPGPNKVAP